MRDAHPREETVGIEWYASDAPGVGGTLRKKPEDFRVREVETIDPAPVGSDTGDYAHLLLRATLRRWDTNDFAARLSDALEMSRERVSWAGTKDKHAVTTQLFSVQGVTADALDDIDIDGADIEIIGRFGRALQFGDLAGNDFSVRVRELDCDADTARERVTGISNALHRLVNDEKAEERGEAERRLVGVPNYFGHQRFGSRRPVTHLVGLHVVRGEWREAVRTYCGNPAPAEREKTQAARAVVDEEFASDDPDWQRALDAIPGYLRYERSMLHRLTEPRDAAETSDEDARFRHALEAVPSNLQRLFVNAAQSYLFNRIVSERLRRGLSLATPVEGDVVCFTDRDIDESFAVPDTDRQQRVTERRVDVMARHCSRGRAFVTAPLIGTETELATGEPGDIEREILDEVDLSPEDFSLPGAFDSTGTRRAILVRTRLDATVDDEGMTVDFALPRGSYATVVLREFLKTDPLDL